MKLYIKQLTVVLLLSVVLSSCIFIDKTAYLVNVQTNDKRTNPFRKFRKKPVRVVEPTLISTHIASRIFLAPSSFDSPSLAVAYTQTTDYEQCIDFEPLEALHDDITSYAKRFLGTRYRAGGRSAKGFDCSNFTSFIMQHFGYKIPSGSSQATHGERVEFEKVRKGDLLFFGYKSKKGGSYRVSHVAMVTSDEGEDMHFIHAARRGITIDNLESSSWKSYYKSRFLFAKRIIQADKNETLAIKGNEFVPNQSKMP
jgi:cell wall-associated NlpC family hydrolase